MADDTKISRGPNNQMAQTEGPTRESQLEAQRLQRLRLGGSSRRMVYVQSVDPCCMSLASGVIFLAIMEIIIYMIALGYYAAFVWRLNESNDSEIRSSWWGHDDFYDGQERKGILPKRTTQLLVTIGIVEAAVCLIYVLVSILLLIGAAKRVASFNIVWISTVICLSITRLILLIFAPVPVFQFGLIWLLFELYFIFVVLSFYYEIKAYPDGINYGIEYPIEYPIVEPIYNYTYAYPPTYQLVPVNQRTIYVQNTNQSMTVPNTNQNQNNMASRNSSSGDNIQ